MACGWEEEASGSGTLHRTVTLLAPELISAVGEMLGLEVVRLGATLDRVTRPYCFDSVHPQ